MVSSEVAVTKELLLLYSNHQKGVLIGLKPDSDARERPGEIKGGNLNEQVSHYSI